MTLRSARFVLPLLALGSLCACQGMSDSQRRVGTGALRRKKPTNGSVRQMR